MFNVADTTREQMRTTYSTTTGREDIPAISQWHQRQDVGGSMNNRNAQPPQAFREQKGIIDNNNIVRT